MEYHCGRSAYHHTSPVRSNIPFDHTVYGEWRRLQFRHFFFHPSCNILRTLNYVSWYFNGVFASRQSERTKHGLTLRRPAAGTAAQADPHSLQLGRLQCQGAAGREWERAREGGDGGNPGSLTERQISHMVLLSFSSLSAKFLIIIDFTQRFG